MLVNGMCTTCCGEHKLFKIVAMETVVNGMRFVLSECCLVLI